MRTSRKIGIDLDGVLIDHRAHKLLLAQEYGISLEPWQVNANVMADHVPPEQMEPLKSALFAHCTVAAPPVAGCLKALAALKAEVYIVSARRASTIRFAQDWLVANRVYDHVPAERIFFCGTDEEKRGYCDRLRIELFLDDRVSVLNALPSKTGRVLFDEDGVSEHMDLGDNIQVVSTWADFVTLAHGGTLPPRNPPPEVVAEATPVADSAPADVADTTIVALLAPVPETPAPTAEIVPEPERAFAEPMAS